MLTRALYYIRYKLSAKNRGGHGIHSPFLFELYQQTLTKRLPFSYENQVSLVRKRYQQDGRQIEIADFGTKKNRTSTLSSLAKRISIQGKYARMLYRLVQHLAPTTIIELGTGLGISTFYLSLAAKSPVYSLDGCKESQQIAAEMLKNRQQDVYLINMNLNTHLATFLQDFPDIEFAYIDANHTEEATLNYFSLIWQKKAATCCVVIHDIYLNTGMKNAWKKIISNKEVTLSLDLYGIGIVFYNPKLSKQHHVISY